MSISGFGAPPWKPGANPEGVTSFDTKPYKAGGADDPQGKTGIAHFLEHLMFTGTKNYPEGVYDKSIARVGGSHNAYTTRDYTAYFATVAKEHLPMVMAMESDRFQNVIIEPTRAARELKVITEERNMRVDNSASAQLAEQLDAITFLNHPYHQPLIGWAEDMATLNADDARAFFTKHYRASNMILLVAGDVSARDVRRHAQHYYGGMPGGDAPTRIWPKEPPVRMSRHAEMEDAKAREPRLLRQYVVPSMREGDASQTVPLAVLAQYLGGGTTSVLYDRLVRDLKLATSVSADYEALVLGPSLLRIEATPAEGVSLPDLEKALDRVLADSLNQVPDEAGIARAKTQLKAEVVFAQDGLEPLAHVMARLYALGLDEQYFYEWAPQIDHVMATDVQAAARGAIDAKRKVTGYLTPAPAEPAHAAAPMEGPYAQ